MNRPATLGKTLLACALIGALSANARADEFDQDDSVPPPTREENIGTMSGLIVGGLVGGPPGVIIGAIGGHYLGRGAAQEQELTHARLELAQVRAELARQKSLAQARPAAPQGKPPVMVASVGAVPLRTAADPLKAIQDGFALTVQFRTDSDRLEPHYRAGITHLAASLRRLPGLRVRLDGFADRRGSDSHNLDLSRRRAESVREALVRAGLEPARVRVSAFGDRRALSARRDVESLGFERRVLISFEE